MSFGTVTVWDASCVNSVITHGFISHIYFPSFIFRAFSTLRWSSNFSFVPYTWKYKTFELAVLPAASFTFTLTGYFPILFGVPDSVIELSYTLYTAFMPDSGESSIVNCLRSAYKFFIWLNGFQALSGTTASSLSTSAACTCTLLFLFTLVDVLAPEIASYFFCPWIAPSNEPMILTLRIFVELTSSSFCATKRVPALLDFTYLKWYTLPFFNVTDTSASSPGSFMIIAWWSLSK